MATHDIHIIGAGPAGLAAALYLAREGHKPVVFEQATDVGRRFTGDFQGLENWSSEDDVTEVLSAVGIARDFRCVPFADGTVFGPSGKSYDIRPTRPLFYLVERGAGAGSLDTGLKQQVLDAGIEIRFGRKVEHATAGKVIVATGPRSPSAIARGMTFQTSHPDGYYGFLGEQFAPRGYAYLLVCGGRATLATCLFDDFKHATDYFKRALDAILKAVPLEVRNPSPFGGYINFRIHRPWVKNNRLYFVGERAGFQDALWGFGLRYAMLSGVLAARAIIHGEDYDALCQEQIVPQMETALANRLIFSQLGNHGYDWVLRRLAGLDVISKLREHYAPSPPKRMLFEVAKRRIHSQLREPSCDADDCSCLWCGHGREIDIGAMEGCIQPHVTVDGGTELPTAE